MSGWRVTGHTRLVGVMGWPVEHSRSPQMHNAALRAAEMDAVYVPLAVPPEKIGDALNGLAALGFVGANVTIPHKETVIPFLSRLTHEAEVIGAVNTIRVEEDGSLTGHNTDCLGAVGAVEADGASVLGRTVAIVGAGGAGRGVAAGCAFAGAARIIVLNRTASRAEALVTELKHKIRLDVSAEWMAAPLGEEPRDFEWDEVDIVFQMTSLGMKGDRDVPLDVGLLKPSCHVLEAVYAPLETPFLRAARLKGLRTTDGLAMLLEQGAASFEFWFGKAPSRRAMRSGLEETTD